KKFDTDIFPKPIMFLPSIAQTNLHEAGTYLCLLEKFFPEDIKVYWKEKDGNMMLQSQQGDTRKTNDTYMKFSWLTVTGDSMDKEHRCIVKHENNKGGADQEILFPPINEVTPPHGVSSAVLAQLKLMTWLLLDGLGLQLTSTFAYYTYLPLLLKSALHGALVTYCLCRRSAVCCDGK
ncbi:T-cell receptor gamma chain C region 5/10-13, partial [Heterocephalus glaber]